MLNNSVSHERLLKLLSYNPETGLFTWLVSLKGCGGHVKVGKPAGSRHSSGYITISVDGVPYQAHRLAWFYVYAKWPADELDHINRDRADNCISNLKVVSKAENQYNIGLPKHNRSGCLNVFWNAPAGKWKVHMKVLGKNYFGGNFECKLAANIVAADMRKKLHPSL